MKTSFITLLALASSLTSVLASPTPEIFDAIEERQAASTLSIVTALYSNIKTYTGQISTSSPFPIPQINPFPFLYTYLSISLPRRLHSCIYPPDLLASRQGRRSSRYPTQCQLHRQRRLREHEADTRNADAQSHEDEEIRSDRRRDRRRGHGVVA